MIQFSPLTVKRWRRFRSIKRGWWSFLVLVVLYVISLFAEVLVNNRALVVKYQGSLRFPTYGAFIPGTEFGEKYDYETDYRALRQRFRDENMGDWVLMPPVPFGPMEMDYRPGLQHPLPINPALGHWLGTDPTGRDVFARLFYGFRITMTFALAFSLGVYVLATALGCIMGYFGGWIDLTGQRLTEIWQALPFLYVVIIAIAVVPGDVPVSVRVGVLLLIMVIFSWADKAGFLRTATIKEKARDYVSAVRLLGASPARIIFRHLLPNMTAILVTFLPFTMSGAIYSLTALDFLNFGLPRPMPSWGELLSIGLGAASHAPWIVTSTVCAITLVLLLVTFVGEAVREAFDPKRFTTYQ
jgi:microcin C transport system permease protein